MVSMRWLISLTMLAVVASGAMAADFGFFGTVIFISEKKVIVRDDQGRRIEIDAKGLDASLRERLQSATRKEIYLRIPANRVIRIKLAP